MITSSASIADGTVLRLRLEITDLKVALQREQSRVKDLQQQQVESREGNSLGFEPVIVRLA